MEKKVQPRISVVMPVYNAGEYLAEAIDSILNQSYVDFEFIIIDDGSSDGTLSILQHYAENETRIKLISRHNKGLIFTLNEGVSIAQGDFIARMDQDDISLPKRFEKQLDFLINHPEHVAIGCLTTLIDSDGDIITPFGEWLTHDEIDKAHIQCIGGAIAHPSAMIRKDGLLKVGGYSEKYKDAEDIDLWLKLAEVGKLANLKERLFLYRQHVDSIGYTKRLSQLKSARRAVEKACDRRKLEYKESAEQEIELPTLVEIYCKWAWWALNSSNIATARKYAVKAFLKKPYDLTVCKLLVCSIRGY